MGADDVRVVALAGLEVVVEAIDAGLLVDRHATLTVPNGATVISTRNAAIRLLGSAFVVAIASSVLPYSLELEALRRLPESVFGELMSHDPAIAAVAGFLVLHQDLGPRDLLAISMVVVASAGAASLSHR